MWKICPIVFIASNLAQGGSPALHWAAKPQVIHYSYLEENEDANWVASVYVHMRQPDCEEYSRSQIKMVVQFKV